MLTAGGFHLGRRRHGMVPSRSFNRRNTYLSERAATGEMKESKCRAGWEHRPCVPFVAGLVCRRAVPQFDEFPRMTRSPVTRHHNAWRALVRQPFPDEPPPSRCHTRAQVCVQTCVYIYIYIDSYTYMYIYPITIYAYTQMQMQIQIRMQTPMETNIDTDIDRDGKHRHRRGHSYTSRYSDRCRCGQ